MMDFLRALIFLTSLTGAWGSCNNPPSINNTNNDLSGQAPYAEGTVVRYTCKGGFRAGGYSNVYTCEGGSWNGGPYECTEMLCPFFNKPRNGKIINNPTYKINSNIIFACDPGYDSLGVTTLRCMIDGWVPSDTPPNCVPKDCGDFGDIAHGTAFPDAPDGVYNDYGSSYHVSCDTGYTLSGGSKVYCEEDGSWGPKPTCILSECPDYPGLNFTKCIKKSFVRTTGTGILYMYCIDDTDRVTKIGDATSTLCINGNWDDPTLRCYCNCECKSDLSNVVYENCNAKGYLAHGSTLSWHCKAGSHSQGSRRISCANGVMSREPVCVADSTTPEPTTPPLGTDCKIKSVPSHVTLANARLGGTLKQSTELLWSCSCLFKKSSEQPITCRNGLLSSDPSCEFENLWIIFFLFIVGFVLAVTWLCYYFWNSKWLNCMGKKHPQSCCEKFLTFFKCGLCKSCAKDCRSGNWCDEVCCMFCRDVGCVNCQCECCFCKCFSYKCCYAECCPRSLCSGECCCCEACACGWCPCKGCHDSADCSANSDNTPDEPRVPLTTQVRNENE